MLCHTRICYHSCEGNESKSACSGCMGEPGHSPAPSPLLRCSELLGGGGGWRAGSCLGILSGEGGFAASQYRELKWRLFLASKFHGLKSHLNPASCHDGLFWRVILAGEFSTFIWRVFMASKSSGFKRNQSKEKRSKLCIFCGPVESHYKHCS
jgi:hypothetical protein